MSSSLTHHRTIEKKILSTYQKMEDMYAYARILRSELDLVNGRYTSHSSASSLIHELDH